jgi:hypothetical protein
VSARDGVGHRSGVSNAVTVVTPASDTGPDTTPPGAPAGLTVTGTTPATATLAWSPSTDDTAVTGYDLHWFDGWFSSKLLATVTGTTFTAPLSTGRSILYVRARDAAGNVSIASNTVTVNGGTTTPPTSPPPGPPVCRVTYTTTAQWPGGFTAGLTVTNTGQTALDGWALAYTFGGDQRIRSAWNSTFTQDGAAVTMRNAPWNGVLAPGSSATIGMRGTWATANSAPTAFTLNGQPCTTA